MPRLSSKRLAPRSRSRSRFRARTSDHRHRASGLPEALCYTLAMSTASYLPDQDTTITRQLQAALIGLFTVEDITLLDNKERPMGPLWRTTCFQGRSTRSSTRWSSGSVTTSATRPSLPRKTDCMSSAQCLSSSMVGLGKAWVNVLLFVLTVLSVLFLGALRENVDVIAHPLEIWRGWPFAVTTRHPDRTRAQPLLRGTSLWIADELTLFRPPPAEYPWHDGSGHRATGTDAPQGVVRYWDCRRWGDWWFVVPPCPWARLLNNRNTAGADGTSLTTGCRNPGRQLDSSIWRPSMRCSGVSCLTGRLERTSGCLHPVPGGSIAFAVTSRPWSPL